MRGVNVFSTCQSAREADEIRFPPGGKSQGVDRAAYKGKRKKKRSTLASAKGRELAGLLKKQYVRKGVQRVGGEKKADKAASGDRRHGKGTPWPCGPMSKLQENGGEGVAKNETRERHGLKKTPRREDQPKKKRGFAQDGDHEGA